jgi:hypothetical protein
MNYEVLVPFKIRSGVQDVSRGLDLCHFPAKKVVESMHEYRNVTTNPSFTIFSFSG